MVDDEQARHGAEATHGRARGVRSARELRGGGEAYDRFMGRYSRPLAVRFADWLEVTAGQRAIDVGCGPGALTGRWSSGSAADQRVRRRPVGAVRRACRGGSPGWTSAGVAEALPFDDDGLRRRGGVPRRALHDRPGRWRLRDAAGDPPGGWVGATVWDLAAYRTPMAASGRSSRGGAGAGRRRGGAGRLGERPRRSASTGAGLSDVEVEEMAVTVTPPDLRGVVGAVPARRRPRR